MAAELVSIDSGRQTWRNVAGTGGAVYSVPLYTGSAAQYSWVTAIPEDFGAAGNGVADDSAAFQLAADSLTGTNGTLLLGNKPYFLGSVVTIPDGVTVQGVTTAIIMETYNASPVLTCGTVLLSDKPAAFALLKLGDRCTVRNVIVDATADNIIPSVGIAIDFTDTYGCRFEWVQINRSFVGIGCENLNWRPCLFTIKHVRIRNTSRGILLNNTAVGTIYDAFIMNPIGNATLYKTGYGIYMQNGCATVNVIASLMEDMQDGARVEGGEPGLGDTKMCNNIYFTDCCFDTQSRAGIVASNMIHSSIKGCFFGGGDMYSIYVDLHTTSLTISQCDMVQPTRHGIVLASTDLANVSIDDCKFCVVDKDSGGYNAVQVNAGVSNWAVRNCQFSQTDVYTANVGHAPYYVNVATGASDRYIVTGNQGDGASGGLNDDGTGENKIVTGNVW